MKRAAHRERGGDVDDEPSLEGFQEPVSKRPCIQVIGNDGEDDGERETEDLAAASVGRASSVRSETPAEPKEAKSTDDEAPAESPTTNSIGVGVNMKDIDEEDDEYDDDDDDEDEEEEEEDGGALVKAMKKAGLSLGRFEKDEEWVKRQRALDRNPIRTLEMILDEIKPPHLDIKHKLSTGAFCSFRQMLWRMCVQVSRMTSFSRNIHNQNVLRRFNVVTLDSGRRRLETVTTLSDVCRLIETSSRILVITGAGISVSAGIPDFRSKQGIYPRLRDEFGLSRPEDMFNLHAFKANPQIFYSFAHELWPFNHQFQPTPTHRFIAELDRRGKLLRNYTQNVDTLEMLAGISESRLCHCHGSFATASCITCKRTVPGQAIHADVIAKRVARCFECHSEERKSAVWPHLSEAERVWYGVMKPDIVFFHESLPKRFEVLINPDIAEADLVLVLGSSLKVAPVCTIIQHLPSHTPAVLINRECVGWPNEFDVELLGNADAVVEVLADKLSWPLDDRRHQDRSVGDSGDEDDGGDAGSEEEDAGTVPADPLDVPDNRSFEQVPDRRFHHVPPNRYLFEGYERPPPASSPTSVDFSHWVAEEDDDDDDDEFDHDDDDDEEDDDEEEEERAAHHPPMSRHVPPPPVPGPAVHHQPTEEEEADQTPYSPFSRTMGLAPRPINFRTLPSNQDGWSDFLL